MQRIGPSGRSSPPHLLSLALNPVCGAVGNNKDGAGNILGKVGPLFLEGRTRRKAAGLRHV